MTKSWTCACGAISFGRECPDCGAPSARSSAPPKPRTAWPALCSWSSGCDQRSSIWVDGLSPLCPTHYDMANGISPTVAGLSLHRCENPRPDEEWFDQPHDGRAYTSVKDLVGDLVRRLSVPFVA